MFRSMIYKHTVPVVDDEADKRRLLVVTWQRTGDDVVDAAEKTAWRSCRRWLATGASCNPLSRAANSVLALGVS